MNFIRQETEINVCIGQGAAILLPGGKLRFRAVSNVSFLLKISIGISN
jgi:hypothetical protein